MLGSQDARLVRMCSLRVTKILGREKLCVLQEDLTLLAMEKTEHGCTLKLTGVCKTCESYEKMHEEIEYEVLIIQQMGRTIVPPKRPRHIPRYTPLTIERDNFHMDFGNVIFQTDYDQAEDIPKGPRRFENEKWAEAVKRNVYPHHSDVDWDEYCEWVSNGGGDEWFQEEI